MANCPKCGANNPEGNRFCSECGAALPQGTGLRCPMCGMLNPLGNVFCDKCNARLVPLVGGPPEGRPEEETGRAPIRGISLPTIPLGAERAAQPQPPGEPAPADWLSEMRAEAEGEELPAAAAEPEPVEIPDWLAGLQPSEPPAAPPVEEAPAAPEVAIPDWLADLQPSKPPAAPPVEEAPAAPEVAIPDWLAGLQPSAPPAAPPVEEAPAAPEVAIPDWLADLQPSKPPAAPPIEEAPAAPEVAIPDWLAGLQPTEPSAAPPVEEAPAAPEPAPAPAEIPDWLAALAPAPLVPPTEERPAPPAEVPDWLAGVETAQPAPSVTEPVPVPAEIPDWLAALAPTAVTPPAEEAPEAPAEVPDWLAGVQAIQATQPEEPPPAPEIPDWLAKLPAAPPPEEAAPAAPAEEVTLPPLPAAPPAVERPLPEGLVPAEIPTWLQALRPKTEAEVAAEEPAEAAGLLQGLRGTLLASPSIDMPAETRPAVPAPPSAAAVARAELLQELISRPAAPPQPLKKEMGQRLAWTLLRVGIGALLIVVILARMFFPIELFSPPAMPAVNNLFQTIEQQVTTDGTVWVAFEYGPAEADEMNVVARPILRHLLDRGARLAIVSTRPEGPAVAAALLAQLLPDEAERGERVENIGYWPGQTVGVQAAAAAARESPMQMLLILAAQPDEMRVWIEQVTPLYPNLPIGAGLSAQAEPLVTPYLDPRAGQLDGAVTGIVGASVYEGLHGGPPSELPFYLNALGIAQLAVVAIMLLGVVISLAGGRRK